MLGVGDGRLMNMGNANAKAGARGRTRTDMLSPTADFESAASTDFATRAGGSADYSDRTFSVNRIYALRQGLAWLWSALRICFNLAAPDWGASRVRLPDFQQCDCPIFILICPMS